MRHTGGRKLLEGSGQVSHDAAIEKAHREYRKYQQKTITPVEEAYLANLKTTEKVVKAQTKPRSKKS